MAIVNSILTRLGDLLLSPWAFQSAWPALIVASFVVAGMLVGLFRLSSNPTVIRRGRDQLLARVLELLLFRHDLRVSLSACWRIAVANSRYLVAFVFPMLVGIVPLGLMFAQMAAWFEHRPLRVGELALVELQLDQAHSVLKSPLTITTSDSLQLIHSGVRIPLHNELCLSLRATQMGPGWIEVDGGRGPERRTVLVEDRVARVATQCRRSGWWQEFLNPTEPPLASSSAFLRFDIRYPARQLLVGDREVPWAVAAFTLVMIFSLLISKLFGVRIA